MKTLSLSVERPFQPTDGLERPLHREGRVRGDFKTNNKALSSTQSSIRQEHMRALTTFMALTVALLFLAHSVHAAPIQRLQGTILEVGEGFLIVTPDDKSSARKFLLRWKAQFVPPKLPLKGDHVLILYKDKEEGAIIYGVNYLKAAPGPGSE